MQNRRTMDIIRYENKYILRPITENSGANSSELLQNYAAPNSEILSSGFIVVIRVLFAMALLIFLFNFLWPF